MSDLPAYTGLFFASFLAATLFPAQSEAVLLGLASTKDYSLFLLVMVASVGNILGSVFNWWIGRSVERFKDKKWFPVKAASLEKAQHWYTKFGRWSLLLSWVPFIGDPITVAAGVMKERLSIFLLIVGLSKTARYVALATGYHSLEMLTG